MDEFVDQSQRQLDRDGSMKLEQNKDGFDNIGTNDIYQQRYNMLRKNTRNLINNIDDDVAQN